jgi:hypothetical protein
MGIKEYYEDEQNCRADILAARKAWGNTTTTREQYDALEKGLGLLYLYCPESMRGIATAHLEEANRRRVHFEMNIWPSREEA